MAQSDNPIKKPRYTGIPTFMRVPFAEDWSAVDIAMIGVPYDGGVTNRPGARHGPREVRNSSSMMRLINQATGCCPYDLARIADIGDCVIERPFQLEGAHGEIDRFYEQVIAAGLVPLSVGGDHSISLPILRQIGKDRPVGMIHIDAHADTGDDYFGSRFHHGAPFRRAAEEGVLDPKRTIQIGIRGGINDRDQWSFSHESGMRVIYMHEIPGMGLDAVIAEALKVAGDGPTYLSFDIDACDPAYAPGTGTPEFGGFTAAEALHLLRGLSAVDFIGGDMVEVSPPFDPSGNTALLGATILFEQLCLLAEAFARRKAA
ncbi:agmatinase [Thalassobaculum sp. OXR-137]|uniref:agmatinase n=1 Tax=Thalassobaculum sp. OXR-137 TaxID=3100173 RepID=UPI002AC92F29|nr:agmatinase [Thalassobaculum sp. OXR-137]WPZ32191.1 agmatinase [Thalassobaculum sp. OXR-137]